jgi:fused signal recognition particle receptor
MLILIVALAVVAFLLVVSAGFIVTTRRRSPRVGAPPAPDRLAPPPAAPPEAPATRAPPVEAEPQAGTGTLAPPAPAEPAAPETTAPPETAPSETLAPETVAPVEPAPVETAPVEAAPVEAAPVEAAPVEAAPAPAPEAPPEPIAPPRFRDRLGKARSLFAGYLAGVRSRDRIDASTWDDLEEALILADVGIDVTTGLLDDLRGRVRAERIESPDALLEALKSDLVGRLEGDRALRLTDEGTTVWLFVGVNGVGKTTTIGKLGQRQAGEGHQVVMAAGDTFRAAAADQLELWADRVGAEVVRGNEGGDPGAVIFDAIQHASARGADLVLADTAGRLHTKVNLMEELKKVRRVAERPPGHVEEVLLVIDATTGQNGLVQAKQFADAVDVTGVVLTKLDGTAKGGIAVAITAELAIPIKLVGLGERPEDLVDFDPREFVDALFAED